MSLLIFPKRKLNIQVKEEEVESNYRDTAWASVLLAAFIIEGAVNDAVQAHSQINVYICLFSC